MAEEPTKTETQEQQDPEKKPEKEAQKTFTREELAQIVSAQLEKERKTWEEQHQSDLEKAKEDGKAEANMTAKELADKKAKEQADKVKQQEDALKKREQELDHREHLAHTKDLLAEQNLPTDGADMLLGSTEDETKANIERFKQLVSQGVRNELHRSSAGKTPQGGAPAQTQTPKKDLADMNYEEMQKFVESQQN